jgi:ubiquinone/menaquinone biosynthesis C-methylase UbiE
VYNNSNHLKKEKDDRMASFNSGNDPKARVQDYFSRTAESYVTSFSHKEGSDLKRLIELGEWQPDFLALDVATGGGHTALAVARHVAHVIVTDLTPRMLEKARENLLSHGVTNATFKVADAEHLPFPDGTFDRVTCRIAPHHFPNVFQFMHEVACVLKPGGIFLLIDCMAPSDPKLDRFDNQIEIWRDSSHVRSLTYVEWEQLVTEARLTIEHVEFFRKTHDFDDWTRRSQMPAEEKVALERFILESDAETQRYFEIQRKADGHLASFTNDYLLVKSRKAAF